MVCVLLLLAPTSFGSGAAYLWGLGFGDASNDYAREIGSDAEGNPIITGYFFDTIDFGGGSLVSQGTVKLRRLPVSGAPRGYGSRGRFLAPRGGPPRFSDE